MRNRAVASLLVVGVSLIVVTGFLVAPLYPPQQLPNGIDSTATSKTPSTFATTTGIPSVSWPQGPYSAMTTKNHLRLELMLNASKVPLGGSVQIGMNLTNLLTSQSFVPRVYEWPIVGLSLPPYFISECPTSSSPYPIGIAVFAGYYVFANVSSGSPLYLAQPGTYYCSSYSFDGYTFMPSSNKAILTPSATPQVIQSTKVISGTWFVGPSPTYTPKFVQFAPGTYTVIEGDEWGDILFLYFDVG